MTTLTEADVEGAALEWLAVLGWQTAHGPDIGPGGTSEERPDYGAVVLERRLRDALARLNPELTHDALDVAYRKLTRPEGSTLEAHNRAFHRTLVDGITVEYRTDGGRITGRQAAVIDYGNPTANDFFAVNQVTVTERDHTRRPDVLLFVNGLPLGVIELKNPADEDADIWTAWQQLQTYKAELPSVAALRESGVVRSGDDSSSASRRAKQNDASAPPCPASTITSVPRQPNQPRASSDQSRRSWRRSRGRRRPLV